ncbi:MAG: fumarylacetoacetase [Sporichthyaceae bacterium]
MTWVEGAAGSGFGIENLPLGAFSQAGGRPRIGAAIGDFVLDLGPVLRDPVFAEPVLNPFLADGRGRWAATRERLVELLGDPRHRPSLATHLIPRQTVDLHLPFEVADYVDFYSCEHHAANVGRMFRPDGPELPANWRHLPSGYHGRAGTVVVSGTPIARPHGQRRGADGPSFGPSTRLDFEAEIGFVVGTPTAPGTRLSAADVAEHVFGVVLLNDWSARDVQNWEYVPLGPFLGKSFATSISPWVVPLDSLAHAWLPTPVQDPEPLEYLRDAGRHALDLALSVTLNTTTISRPPFAQMYWTVGQQLAHLTCNGSPLRTGDLLGSGTVSGPEPGQRGSLLELSWNGAEQIELDDGTPRTFLEDGDTLTIRGCAPGPDGSRIDLGEVTGRIV